MKKTKFIFLSMEVRNGEYEYSSQSVHEISSRRSIEKFAREYAKTFYGGEAFQYDKPIDPDGWWYFNGGEVAARCSVVEEITKEEYETLNKFLWK